MKRFIKKRGLALVLMGGILGIIALSFIYSEIVILRYGKSFNAVVTDVRSVPMSPDTLVLEYLDEQNQTLSLEPQHIFGDYKIGDFIKIYVLGDNITFFALLNGFWLALFTLLFFAIIFIFVGLKKIKKHYQTETTTDFFYKKYGKRVSARYSHSEEIPHTKEGIIGHILFFKEEKGNRVFSSFPVFDSFDESFLHGHLIDVYLHPQKQKDYFIDLEKYFGHPIKEK